MRNPAAETSEPMRSGTFDPTVLERRPEIGPATSMPRVAGTRNRPAWVTLAAKPNPSALGCSTNSGTRMKDENMPKPNSRAARFVVQTPRRRIMCMSTTGAWLRDQHRRRGKEPYRLAGGPAPGRALADRDQQRDQAPAEQDRADRVDPPPSP